MTILEEEKLRVEYLINKLNENGINISFSALRKDYQLNIEGYVRGTNAIANMKIGTAYKVAQLLGITIDDIYTAGGKIK